MQKFNNEVTGIPGEMGVKRDFFPTSSGKGVSDEEVLDGFFSCLAVWAMGRTNYALFLQVSRSDNFPF